MAEGALAPVEEPEPELGAAAASLMGLLPMLVLVLLLVALVGALLVLALVGALALRLVVVVPLTPWYAKSSSKKPLVPLVGRTNAVPTLAPAPA